MNSEIFQVFMAYIFLNHKKSEINLIENQCFINIRIFSPIFFNSIMN